MKIQEHPSMPENKLQRNQDADDQENSFVSEVPRLDLTSLCDDNNWEGRIVWWLWFCEWNGREGNLSGLGVSLCDHAPLLKTIEKQLCPEYRTESLEKLEANTEWY